MSYEVSVRAKRNPHSFSYALATLAMGPPEDAEIMLFRRGRQSVAARRETKNFGNS
jgi:hypothetical protein